MRKANAKGAPGTHTYGTPSDCICRAIKAECRGNECQGRPPLTVTVTVTVPVTGYGLLVTGYWFTGLLVYWFTGLLVYWLLLLIRGLGQPGASVAVGWWLHGPWSPPGLDLPSPAALVAVAVAVTVTVTVNIAVTVTVTVTGTVTRLR